MNKAIVKFKRRLIINDTTTVPELKKIFETVQNYVKNELRNVDSYDESKKALLFAEIGGYIRNELEEYAKTASGFEIYFEEWEIARINNDKNFPENRLVEISFVSETFTLLDSFDNKLLIKRGDMRKRLGEEQPKILHTQFIEVTSNDSIVEYSPF